jgi:hypothetical protein
LCKLKKWINTLDFLGAISSFPLQVFVNPFVFLLLWQELPPVALPQQEKLKRLSQKAFHFNLG